MTERNILVIGTIALVVVMALAIVASKQSADFSLIHVEDLPNRSMVDTYEPAPADCEAAGGEVRWERSNECFSEPNVRDVCLFGVPCINDRGYQCIDVKDPYCVCESDAQCPDGYTCNESYGADRCVHDFEQGGIKPYPSADRPTL